MPALGRDLVISVLVEMRVPSAISMWPKIIAAPPMVQWRPIFALPAMPVQAAIAVCAPMTHVVRNLDLVVELDAVFDDRVFQRAAVDGGIGADFDIVADQHAANLRNFFPAPSFGAKPKPSAPMTQPECRMARSPISQR